MVKRSGVYDKVLYIKSQGAEPAPPLGTILGNLGVNTSNFCVQFNNYTRNLPIYYRLATLIRINENRSFSFSVSKPHVGTILNLLKFNCVVKVREKGLLVDKVIIRANLYEVSKLTKWKFGFLNESSFKVIMSVVKTHGLIVARSRTNLPMHLIKKRV